MEEKDQKVLEKLLKWKDRRGLNVRELQEVLQVSKSIYHRRINNGKWKFKELELMRKLGILRKKRP